KKPDRELGRTSARHMSGVSATDLSDVEPCPLIDDCTRDRHHPTCDDAIGVSEKKLEAGGVPMPMMALADQQKLYLIDQLEKARNQIERAKDYGRSLKEKAKAETNLYIGAAVSAATSGVIGYYEGRKGTDNLFGPVPIDLAVAAAGFGLGFF